jgi:hypothetical protein
MHQVVRYASEPRFRVGFCPKKLLEQLQNLQNHKISQLNMQVQCQREEFQERVGITTFENRLESCSEHIETQIVTFKQTPMYQFFDNKYSCADSRQQTAGMGQPRVGDYFRHGETHFLRPQRWSPLWKGAERSILEAFHYAPRDFYAPKSCTASLGKGLDRRL